jgi:UDP-glucose 4-epimerase
VHHGVSLARGIETIRYLVTGGAGFIGSHLCDRLLANGDHVCVIDDLSTGSEQNIAHLKGRPGFEYVVDTMLNGPLLAELVDSVDGVFHLAAAVGVHLIVESPVRTIETNVRCTELLLAIAARKKKRVLLASTSEVYGKSTAIPFREEGDVVMGAPTCGRWSYACSKAIDEFLAIAYWREKRLPTVIVRLFNTVGPRQTGRYGMVVPRFVSQALHGAPITVYGNGTQTRCFTHVSDAVTALAAIIRTDSCVGEVYNVGNEDEITILALANLVQALTRSSSRIVFVPYAVAYQENFEDMARRVPCIEKIRQAVGWEPTIGINDILQSVIHFHDGITPIAASPALPW